jgi:bidirectional [NiFe] hydrogenase diaphorase subunit
MISVTVDDKTVIVKKGTTILDAARLAGVSIPTLCHHPALKPTGACRLCSVELVNPDKTSSIVTSCNYPLHSDAVVRVSSERAKNARRGIMELLLARSPESEYIRDLGKSMGVTSTRFPTVTETQRDCVLCGRCVAVCEEVIGASAISFAGRGVNRATASPFREPADDCIACGACAAVCPVGTIQVRIDEKAGVAEISPFKSRKPLLICESCGAQMVSKPVAVKTTESVKFDWKEFRRRSGLCPDCRRKESAGALGLVELKRAGVQLTTKEGVGSHV